MMAVSKLGELDDRYERLPRENRTPNSEAFDTIQIVVDFFEAASVHAGVIEHDAFNYFFNQVFPIAIQKDGDALLVMIHDQGAMENKILEDEYKTGFMPFDVGMMHLAEMVLAFVGRVISLVDAGEINLAWTYAVDAQRWAGTLRASFEANHGFHMPQSGIQSAELRAAISASFSSNGRKGAQAKADKKQPIVEFVIQKWAKGTWKNANHAAYCLQHEVKKMMTNSGVPFSESNLQKTIASWINVHKKSV